MILNKNNILYQYKTFILLISLWFFANKNLFCQNYSVVGTGTTSNTSTTYPAPLGNDFFGAKHQFFVTAAQISLSGIPANASLSSLAYHLLNTNGSATTLSNYSVKVYTTTSTNPIAFGYLTTGLVAQSSAQTLSLSTLGWKEVNFLGSFVWNGTSNLVIETCFNNTTATANASTEWTTSGLGAATWSRYYRANSSTNCNIATATATSTTTRPNIQFGWYPPSPTSINTSTSTVCIGDSVTLTANGVYGNVYWYTSSCGGNLIDSGAVIKVLPSFPSTAYYAKNKYNGIFSSGCSSTIVNVSPLAISGTASSNQTICSGTSPADIILSNYTGAIQWQLSSDNISWSNLLGATASTLTSAQMGNLSSIKYYRAIVSSNPCSSVFSNTITININPLPTVFAGNDQTICNGNSIIFSGSGASTYTWSNGVFNNIAFSPTTTVTYTLTGVDANGCINTDQIIVNVNPNSNSGTASSNQSICYGGLPSNKILTGYTGTVQWQFSNNNITWNNIISATSATLTSAQMGTLSTTTYYRAIVKSGVCFEDTSNFITVTVFPTSEAGVATSSQTICSSTAPNELVLTGFVGSIQWQYSLNGTTGWTNIVGANNDTLTSAQMGALTVIRYYRAIVTSGTCSSVTSNTITINLNTQSLSGTASSSQTICINSSPSNITLTGFNGSIQWQSSLDNINWNNISGATSNTLSSLQTGTLSNTTYFRALITNGVCSAANSNTVIVSVTPNSIAGIATSSQTICTGTSPSSLTLSGYLGTIQWQVSTNNITWSNIPGAITSTLTSVQMGTLSVVRYYRANVTNGICSLISSNTISISINPLPTVFAGNDQTICKGTSIILSGSGASTYSWSNGVSNNIAFSPTTTVTYTLTGVDANGCINTDQIIVNVNPNSIGGTASANQSICFGAQPSNKILTGYTGTIQWQFSNNNTTWNNIISATSATLTSAQMGTLSTTTYYRAIVKSGVCFEDTSNFITVTVFPTSVPGVAASSQTICSNTIPNDLVLTGYLGSIQWQYSLNGTTGWTAIPAAINDTLTSAQMGALTSTRYYRAVITSGNCASLSSNTVIINVTPNSIGGNATSSQSLCINNFPSNKILTGSVGSIQWQFSTDNTIWNNIAGATTATLSSAQMGTLSTTTFFRAYVTSGICDSASSNTIIVTVFPLPISGTAISNQTICSGSSPSEIVLVGSLGSIQWQSSLNNSTWTNITGANNDTLTSAQMGALTSIRYYRAIISSGPCSTVTSNTITINVNTQSIGGTASSNQTICANSSPSNITLTGFNGSIQWQSSSDNINWNNISGATSNTLSSLQAGTLTSTTFFRALVTNGVCSTVNSNTVIVSVTPNSIAGIAASSQTICTGTSPSSLTLSGYLGTIQWQVSTNNVTWSNIPSGTTSTLTSAQMGTLSAVRYYRANVKNGICSLISSNTITISISPLSISGTVSSNQTICSGTSPTDLNLIGNLGDIQWQTSTNNSTWIDISSATTSTLTSAQMGAITSTTYFRALVKSGACSTVATNTITITITPTSIAGIASANQIICANSSPSNKTLTGYNGTIQWQKSTDNINWLIIPSATTSTLTSAQMGSISVTTYYRSLVTYSFCPAAFSNTITVSVVTPPTAGIVSSSQSLCAGSVPNNLNINNYNGTLQWQYSLNGTTGWTSIPGATTSALTSAQMASLTSTRFYRVMVSNSPCASVYSNIISIVFNSLPSVSAGANQTICLGSSVILSASGASTYVWSGGVINNIAFTPTVSQTYTVTGTSANGCIKSAQVNVFVNQPPTANLIYNQPAEICQGQNFLFTSSTNNGINYQWKFNNNNILGANSSNYSAINQGNYSVIITNSNGCSKESPIAFLSVLPLPLVDAGLPQNICYGDTVVLSGAGSNNYTWSNNVSNNQPFVPISTNSYTVSTVGVNGCLGTDQVLVTVNYSNDTILNVSTLGSYNLNGIVYSQSGTYFQTLQNQFGCDSIITLNLNYDQVGITEIINNLNLNIFPNPSNDGIFYLNYNNKFEFKNCSLFIKNITGQIIQQFELLPKTIDLKDNSAGIYFIEIKLKEGTIPFKIIKIN